MWSPPLGPMSVRTVHRSAPVARAGRVHPDLRPLSAQAQCAMIAYATGDSKAHRVYEDIFILPATLPDTMVVAVLANAKWKSQLEYLLVCCARLCALIFGWNAKSPSPMKPLDGSPMRRPNPKSQNIAPPTVTSTTFLSIVFTLCLGGMYPFSTEVAQQ